MYSVKFHQCATQSYLWHHSHTSAEMLKFYNRAQRCCPTWRSGPPQGVAWHIRRVTGWLPVSATQICAILSRHSSNLCPFLLVLLTRWIYFFIFTTELVNRWTCATGDHKKIFTWVTSQTGLEPLAAVVVLFFYFILGKNRNWNA